MKRDIAMREKIQKLKAFINANISGGILWIFGSGVVSQISGFISSVVVIRKLPKADYGMYVDAYNIYCYINVFIGLGLVNAVLQFCSENTTDARRGAIYRFARSRGGIFNLVLLALIIAAGSIYKPDDAGFYLRIMCAYPIVIFTNKYYRNVLRVKRENKEYGIVCITYAVVVFFGNIIFTYCWGIVGLVLSSYLAYIATIIVARLMLRREGFSASVRDAEYTLSRAEKKELLSYSVLSAMTDFVAIVLVLLDITCLNLVLGDPAVLADYKVAMAIPTAMLFVADSLSLYYYPSIVEAYSTDRADFAMKTRRCIKVFLVISAACAFLMFIFADLIIYVIYGEKYMNMVPVYRVLTLNFLVNSGVRKFLGNVIAAIKKVKINLLFASVAGVMNIVLDILFIRLFGVIGAAIATLIVTVFIGALETLYVLPYVRGGGEKKQSI